MLKVNEEMEIAEESQLVNLVVGTHEVSINSSIITYPHSHFQPLVLTYNYFCTVSGCRMCICTVNE